MPLDEVQNEPPADLDERTVVFLDCGNIDRMPVDFLQRDGIHIVNVDHHHDNTRFGTVNLVDPHASCTAEIVWELAKELGAEITPAIGDALYVGLVTDTGKFMYTNTSPRSHRMAAELMEAGVDTHGIYRRLYEELPYARLLLLSRALNAVQRFDDGVVTATCLTRADFEETGAVESDSEGIVDHLRAVEGTKVAVLVRELLSDDRDRHAQGQHALDRRHRGRLADRARPRRRRPPAGGRRVVRPAARRAARDDPQGHPRTAIDAGIHARVLMAARLRLA